jgi:hypothetical protein
MTISDVLRRLMLKSGLRFLAWFTKVCNQYTQSRIDSLTRRIAAEGERI